MKSRDSSTIQLNNDERESIRKSLLTYIDQNPIEETSYVIEPTRSRTKYLPTLAVALLALVLLGGTAYASEYSVPGEMLYTMKTGVNERVLALVARSHSSKAQLEVRLADRRLEEAEKLNAQAKLSEETKAQLSTDIVEHLKTAGTHVDKMIAAKDFASVEAATAELETALTSHAKILPTLSLIGNVSSFKTR
jgi:hypothetical protein